MLAGWAALTAEFACRTDRCPGPDRGPSTGGGRSAWMLPTSVLIPPAAVAHRVRGMLAARDADAAWPRAGAAVLFDRDGTLVHDVPYNGDPAGWMPAAGRPRHAGPAARRAASRSAWSPTSPVSGAGLLDAGPGGRGEPPDRAGARPVRRLARSARTRPDDGCRVPQAGARAGAGGRRRSWAWPATHARWSATSARTWRPRPRRPARAASWCRTPATLRAARSLRAPVAVGSPTAAAAVDPAAGGAAGVAAT